MDDIMSPGEANTLEEQWRNERYEHPVGSLMIMKPDLKSLITDRKECSNHASTMMKA